MKGDAGVIDYLNKALRSELTAISQYWLHYRLQDDWGCRQARREVAQGEHRGDAPCRQADGPHHLPRGPSEPADPRPAPDRREPARDAGVRPRRRIRRPHALHRGARLLRERRRLRVEEPLRGADVRRGRPYRLPGDPARPRATASASRTGTSSTRNRPTRSDSLNRPAAQPRAPRPFEPLHRRSRRSAPAAAAPHAPAVPA